MLEVEFVQKYAVTYQSEKYGNKLSGFFDNSPGVIAFDIAWWMIDNKYGRVDTKEFPKRKLPRTAYKNGYPRFYKDRKEQGEAYIGHVALRLLRMILPDVMRAFRSAINSQRDE